MSYDFTCAMGKLAWLNDDLDRIICMENLCWTSNVSSYINSQLPKILLDHIPLVLIVFQWFHSKTKTFIFDNYWLEYWIVTM